MATATATAAAAVTRPRVLFVSARNAGRSQLAEGLMRKMYGDHVVVESAGTNPGSKVDESVVDVLKERNVDISHHRPKSTADLLFDQRVGEDVAIDYVIVLCSVDQGVAPALHGHKWKVGQFIYHIFDDPAAFPPEGEDGLAGFRRVRDQISHFLAHHVPFTSLLLSDPAQLILQCFSQKSRVGGKDKDKDDLAEGLMTPTA